MVMKEPFKKEDLAAVLAAYFPSATSRAAGPGGPVAVAGSPAVGVSTPSLDSSVFDWEGALETFLGQKETVRSLLRRFLEKAGSQMDELAEAFGAKDLRRFMEVSHSLKGASWNLSARRLGDAALMGETAGREGDIAAASPALAAIRTAFADFAEAASVYTKD